MNPRVYILLADGLLAVHMTFVVFIVVGLVLVYLGGWRQWQWVRNRWFRLAHIGGMAIVLGQALCGAICPLTIWEARLRQLGGQEKLYEGTFMQYWVGRLLYQDWRFATFTLIYALFFIVVVLSFILVPPRWRKTDG